MTENKEKILFKLLVAQHKVSRIQTRDIDNKQSKEDALKYLKEAMELLI